MNNKENGMIVGGGGIHSETFSPKNFDTNLINRKIDDIY